MKLFSTLFFLALTVCILTHSQISLSYALMGLNLWYEKMIPSLLPFMMVSGIMVRAGLTEGFSSIVYPVIKPVYRVSRNVCYAMIIGFLCGFPMGAKTVQDLYLHKMISEKEANYLLAFCNNIGPVYFITFVLPLLNRTLMLPYLFGMYGIPLLYGFLLRYTYYTGLQTSSPIRESTLLPESNLLTILDDAVNSAIQSILSLGGYMILFNLLNLLPHILLGHTASFLAPLLEISGGLYLLGDKAPLYVLLLLPFGGLSCIAQTYSCLKGTGLSIKEYLFHKFILVILTVLFYLSWSFCSSSSFLR